MSEARDLIEQDLARHERVTGREVHALQNQTLAAEALEIAERMAVRQVDAPPPAPVENKTERRELNGHKYVVSTSADENADVAFRTTTEFERNVLAFAQPRIRLLMSLKESGPLGGASWAVKTYAALFHKVKAQEAVQSGMPHEAEVFEKMFQQDLYELLESSNQTFGDWRKGSAKPVSGSLIVMP